MYAPRPLVRAEDRRARWARWALARLVTGALVIGLSGLAAPALADSGALSAAAAVANLNAWRAQAGESPVDDNPDTSSQPAGETFDAECA